MSSSTQDSVRQRAVPLKLLAKEQTDNPSRRENQISPAPQSTEEAEEKNRTPTWRDVELRQQRQDEEPKEKPIWTDILQTFLAFLALNIGVIFGVFAILSWKVAEQARLEANDGTDTANKLSLLQYCSSNVRFVPQVLIELRTTLLTLALYRTLLAKTPQLFVPV